LPGETVKISYFRKKNAIEARRILKGLIIGLHEGVDLSALPLKEAKGNVTLLGKAKH